MILTSIPDQEEHLWKKQFQEAIKSQDELKKILAEFGFKKNFSISSYPLFIPRDLLNSTLKAGPHSPLWKQFIPSDEETAPYQEKNGLIDPIGDHSHAKYGQIIHRYKNRVLFLPLTVCPVHCRYCFRKNELYEDDKIFKAKFDITLDYLSKHKEVNEIIFTGGDPLILSNSKIDFYLNKFGQIPHIKYIRFHTRTPVILPSRITNNLINLLKKYSTRFKQVNIVIHTNHKDELDLPDVAHALERLGQIKVNVLSQSVLLRGVNDNFEQLFDLFTALIELNIRPYYLHHSDKVKGGLHFYLPLEKGRKLYGGLKNVLPGWAVPHYVVDLPGGEGKIQAFNPESYDFSGKFFNKDGHLVTYLPPHGLEIHQ